ncbi:type II toxin-antitoxin system PemK/MazF family toxin [Bacillus inaquosorum]|uniref:type II toxin-antitoxin system PemK/MazF family toxin n=1 Tax=Bacillus inaquosorum TaxID=483913 RepID=UPI00227E7D13|nr:type II toxin-antitoxin system PemK/MazF family toxin [Bacillus inaquosorum]MCY7751392.1 type II toxin-antitoxin system PemK/MazF family toxin [Bacillus inaquosorum]
MAETDPKKLELGNIHLAITEFRDGTGRKARPVLVLGSKKSIEGAFEPEVLIGYITSNNNNKNFSKFKYPIADWKAAGLDKESWVVLQERELKWMNHEKDFLKHIGLLTERDTIGVLNKFIEVRELEQSLKQEAEKSKPQPRKGKMQVTIQENPTLKRSSPSAQRRNSRER